MGIVGKRSFRVKVNSLTPFSQILTFKGLLFIILPAQSEKGNLVIKPMKTFLTLIAILLSLSASLSANGGTIRTAITTTQTVKDSGAIELEFKIRNRGNATAHNVVVTLILADLVKSYDHLGDNPPGGEIRLEERIVDSGLNPPVIGKSSCAFKIFLHIDEKIGREQVAVPVLRRSGGF